MDTSRLLGSLALVLSMLFQVCSIGFGKQASISLPSFDAASIATSPFYFISLCALGLQAVAWQFALRRYPLAFAYFVMAGSFIGVLGISHFVFVETLTWRNYLGTGVILVGLLILFKSQEDPA